MAREFFEELGDLPDEMLLSLRDKVSKGFSVYEATYDKKVLLCKVTPRYSHEESFNRVLEEFKGTEYVPLYREINGSYRLLVVHKKDSEERRIQPTLHLFLIAVTLLTMTWAGYVVWTDGNLRGSIIFAVALMTILGVHETGHALTARRRDVKATLPFFIPVPPPIFPFGTLGAVIFMNSPIKNRKVLMDVGVAGPLAGFLISLPILIVGLKLSTALPEAAPLEKGNFLLGPSLLFLFLVRAFFEGAQMVDLHPLAVAGWIGLFVTSLNLLPMGQLDGGHVVRGFARRHYRKVYFAIALLLLGLGMIWPGWIIWPLFVWLITRFEHPGPLDDVSELDWKRKLLGLIAILILILTFMPVPIVPAEFLQLENLNK